MGQALHWVAWGEELRVVLVFRCRVKERDAGREEAGRTDRAPQPQVSQDGNRIPQLLQVLICKTVVGGKAERESLQMLPT